MRADAWCARGGCGAICEACSLGPSECVCPPVRTGCVRMRRLRGVGGGGMVLDVVVVRALVASGVAQADLC